MRLDEHFIFSIFFVIPKQNTNNDRYQLDNLGHSLLFTFCDKTRYILIVFSDKALYNNKTGQNNKKSPFRGSWNWPRRHTTNWDAIYSWQKYHMSAMNGGSLWRSCMGLLSLTLPTRWISAEMKRALQNRSHQASLPEGSLGLSWRWETSHPGVLSVKS